MNKMNEIVHSGCVLGPDKCPSPTACTKEWRCRAFYAETLNMSDIKASAIDTTLAQRGTRYGDFTDNAEISQALKDTAVACAPAAWDKLDRVKKEALTVIFQKIARILNGDPNYKDNWHDIAGYAKLAEDRCKETVE